jgi:nicotinate-nucleotide adenylyltransferase
MSVAPGRVGLLGGTFDPVHLGHLAIADAARESLGLERVILVPAGEPPHKPGVEISPPEDRLGMLRLATAGFAGFEVSTIELERAGPSYSADTVEAFAATERAAGREPDLWFILSAEAFAELGTWREPERVLRACRLAVVPRAGHAAPDRAGFAARFPGFDDRVAILDGPGIRLSASEIRARARAGRSIRFLVPPAVAAYIGDHGLYRQPA